MRLRLLAAAAAVLVSAGLAPAQTVFAFAVANDGTGFGSTVGRWPVAAGKVAPGGAVTVMTPPAGYTWMFHCGYTISPNAAFGGGYGFTTTGRMLPVRYDLATNTGVVLPLPPGVSYGSVGIVHDDGSCEGWVLAGPGVLHLVWGPDGSLLP